MDIDVDLYEDLPEETNSDHIAKVLILFNCIIIVTMLR